MPDAPQFETSLCHALLDVYRERMLLAVTEENRKLRVAIGECLQAARQQPTPEGRLTTFTRCVSERGLRRK